MNLYNFNCTPNIINFEVFKSYQVSYVDIGPLNDVVGNEVIDVNITFNSLMSGRSSIKVKIRFLSINKDKYTMASMVIIDKPNDQITIQLESYLIRKLYPIALFLCRNLSYIDKNSEIIGGLYP